MDNELFELCKEVYEKTGWKATGQMYSPIDDKNYIIEVDYVYSNGSKPKKVHGESTLYTESDVIRSIPLYTSDYLLEKLPVEVKVRSYPIVTGRAPDISWMAEWYKKNDDERIPDEPYFENSKTPLKALLRLTIALHEAGELQPASNGRELQ